MSTATAARAPAPLRALAHDLRWAIVRLLAGGDMRVREVVAATGQAPNLITYHLAQLRAAGLVWVRRSTADGRDSYYALDLDAIDAAMQEVSRESIQDSRVIARMTPPHGRPPERVGCCSSAPATAHDRRWLRAGSATSADHA